LRADQFSGIRVRVSFLGLNYFGAGIRVRVSFLGLNYFGASCKLGKHSITEVHT
jgi:hypothetical protein